MKAKNCNERNIYESYDLAYDIEPNYINRTLYKKILNIFIGFSNDISYNFLDIGCGHGGFLKYLFDNEFSYKFKKLVGIDYRCKEINSKKLDKEISLYQGDLFNLKERISDKFNNILLFDVLEHLTIGESLEILNFIKTISSEKASILIHVPNGNSPFSNSIRYADLTHKRSYTPFSLKQLILSSDLKPEKIEFLSDKPTIHGFKSLIRFVLWRIIEIIICALDLIETGSTRSPYTRNLYCIIKLK